MGDLDALADAGEEHGVVADHVATANRRKTDRLGLALAGMPFAAVDRTGVEIAPQFPRHHFAHAQRSAGRRIDLEAVMRLDDLDVIALRKDARGNLEEAEHGIYAHRHVGRENHRNLARHLGDRRLARGIETGRADHHRLAELARQRQMAERALGAGEVDHAVGGGDRRRGVIDDPDVGLHTGHLARVTPDEGRARTVEGGREDDPFFLQCSLDQHPAHSPGSPCNCDSNVGHRNESLER